MTDPDRPHPYLGTSLTPRAYYALHAHAYDNPHAEGIAAILTQLAPHLHGTVLDLGCGDGLATKLLAGREDLAFVGADLAPGMVKRYRAETGRPGLVAGFGDALPACDSAVACYALHLATPAEIALLWWRLAEAGAQLLVVVTPFKQRPADPAHYFTRELAVQGPHGPDGKTIHGRLYRRLPETV